METKIKGIDVSANNGVIDWKKVKSGGVEFAIIKATQGKDGKYLNGFTDSYFERNYAEAKAAGIKVGAYHFAVFTTEAQAKAEAQQFMAALKSKSFEYPVCLDLEDLPAGRSPIISSILTKQQLTNYSILFMEELRANGYKAMLYTNSDWRKNKLDYTKLSNYLLWQAHYTASRPAAVDDKVAIWQYSGSGKVNGISGNVDMNWAFVDLSASCAKATATVQSKTKTVDELAKEVIAGKWGNGQDRKDKLTAAGYDYTTVQARVNALLKG